MGLVPSSELVAHDKKQYRDILLGLFRSESYPDSNRAFYRRMESTQRRHKEDRNGGGRGSGPESRGRPWSRLFERECPTRANGSGKDLAGSLFVNYGRSMPLLPTTVSQCNLTDDSFSCTNLSVGLTGFPELPAKVKFTRHHRNRMNHELSYAIATAKSKVNLSEIHEALSRQGAAQLPDDEDSRFVDNPYEVVIDIKTPL
ncbi:uncharacterized protein LOC111272521 isoform X3 [Varroa jacobsoni]|uniref:Uncharacterized protein n=1 Tax=Varroa destructor TaxID=109461 RepID=A0A7M7MA26_VARDE|nr:uncharacterized protein LOC111250281 isoform X2 [Varroa destructor]XP_022660996.1 uncharacterized protein LOC111250281 isoform X2 [Varroa destructor]XP_022660997.1 uncharacterized protein LOC111250281 isoform X2 [Varroa destructor]XP_022709772.1 uncharacterized protein LOC111272521 isoform X3 [Varroa jacobsoni]XP_022709776.1 uncharacterized protein LOC111272521 isoform X3 [Varroa jacobsoni]XP_022709784.1 uncharacterized protein LOC111272521 isoform X3 [Varroa jacobsoni]XP_022709793.1 uncha